MGFNVWAMFVTLIAFVGANVVSWRIERSLKKARDEAYAEWKSDNDDFLSILEASTSCQKAVLEKDVETARASYERMERLMAARTHRSEVH